MKSKLYIDLSNKCEAQAFTRATKESKLPGKKYFNQVPAPTDNEIRIAVAGDSTGMGLGATSKKQFASLPIEAKLTDQTDGSVAGQQGWPYLLHELLRNNN